MRKQTKKATFNSEDISLQADDQFKISDEDIEGLRGLYDKKLNSEIEVQQNMHKKQLEKAKRKAQRKKSKD
jgi:pyridoxine 5'-phosphate synthase PdxJ